MSASRLGKALARCLTLALALGIAAVAQPVAYACACGAFAPGVDAGNVRLTAETAIVSTKDGVERIDLQLDVDTLTTTTGLIVPTPTPATVSLGTLSDFSALTTEMTPRRIQRDEWWERDPSTLGITSGGAPPQVAAPPTVLKQVQLGPIEATVLAADDAAGLTGWLTTNGYGLAPEVTDLLVGYVDRQWSFVALKLTGEVPLDGGLNPISFEFASEQLVYPLALSAAATTPQSITLYVLTDHRQQATFLSRGQVAYDIVWAAPVRTSALAQRGAYLTAMRMSFADPATQIRDDLVFNRAGTDAEVGTEVVVVHYMSIMGYPIGWLLVGFAALVGVAILMISLIPRRGYGGRRRR
jgi:hypothetical protein